MILLWLLSDCCDTAAQIAAVSIHLDPLLKKWLRFGGIRDRHLLQDGPSLECTAGPACVWSQAFSPAPWWQQRQKGWNFYIFMAALGLHRCVGFFSSSGERGPLSGTRASHCGGLSGGAQPQQLWLQGVWDLPGPGIEPLSPALAGRFFTLELPKKPLSMCS